MNKTNLEQSVELYNTGVKSLELNQLEEAHILFKKAIKINPNFFQAHYNIGNVLRRIGKLTEAIPFYKNCLKIKGDFFQAHYSLHTSHTIFRFCETVVLESNQKIHLNI